MKKGNLLQHEINNIINLKNNMLEKQNLLKIKDNLPIDMVISYVNGNDINYINKKNDFIKKNNINLEYHPEIRSVNIDEIKYCVSSVLKFIPWIRKIFIITNDQIPPIKKELIDSGKVIIINQNNIIDNKYLPTFNSDVIESYMHKIDDLSEIFLYNNDDMFNTDYIMRRDIYEINGGDIRLKINGKFKKRNYINNQGEYARRILFTANFLEKNFSGIKLYNNHHTRILRKSTLSLVENKFPDLLDSMRKNNFRNVGYIQYLFFVTNIDNYLHKNNISSDYRDILELHLNDKIYDKTMFNRVDKGYKFLCLNSMNSTCKEQFQNLMKKLGVEPV